MCFFDCVISIHKSELPYQVLRATTPSRAPAPIRGHAHNLPIASHHRALSSLGFNLSTWEDSALDRKSWRETLHTTGVRRFMQWWTEKRARTKPHRQASASQQPPSSNRSGTEPSGHSQAHEQTAEEGERMEDMDSAWGISEEEEDVDEFLLASDVFFSILDCLIPFTSSLKSSSINVEDCNVKDESLFSFFSILRFLPPPIE